MSSYDDIATSSAFLAGRDAARTLRREGVGWGPDNGDRMCPRGLDSESEIAWLRGWRSAWE
ncbi:hypothetical protein PP568_07105 [Mycobacteroides abscessus]|nr:hypothetical protein [Mycobacteroides abscessus]MBN7462943.1 hypothetical protein [Mycobacteroides abscessus subsp. abscessus]MBN7555305.1 hypothetical protein [Mycobacteroides abscessus subsp. abscessus]MDM2404700.1 hypothetical protein [Mycobacteroides abscessus]MDM2414418.1 hypothetical protein [Mycobacteroides abscessus]MDO3012015.1 hypothetical protein [Mycobacteroides abscessus subsp. abscessus]